MFGLVDGGLRLVPVAKEAQDTFFNLAETISLVSLNPSTVDSGQGLDATLALMGFAPTTLLVAPVVTASPPTTNGVLSVDNLVYLQSLSPNSQ